MNSTQVKEFAKLSFEKNEESTSKPVYVGVDDAETNVRKLSAKLFFLFS
jgi:hypothetical protein